MQSTWGPRVFWFIVFALAVAGVYAFFYEPQPELGPLGNHGTVENVLTLSPKLVGVEIQLGTSEPVPEWSGSISLQGGKVLQVHPVSRVTNWSWKENRFQFTPPRGRTAGPTVLQVVVEAEGEALLTLSVRDETQTMPLGSLSAGTPTDLFGGKARLRRTAPVQLYNHDNPVDDFAPVFVHDKAGNAHLLYLSCTKTKGPDAEAVLNGSFGSLDEPITGVSIRLSHYAHGSWQYSEPVGEKLESVLDPAAAIDGSNRMYVAWSQQGPEGWDIYYTFKELSAKGDVVFSWNTPVKLTEKPGTHQQLAAVTDAKGKVWLAWQAWHYDHFEIYAAVLNDSQHAWAKPGPIAEHSRDEEGRWQPALAADGLGNVYVAWSVFRGGHFDLAMVRLNENSAATKPIALATSERQEQRPSLRCDGENQLWVAYEESEGESGSFATPTLAATKVRVRIVSTDLRISDVPPVPRPPRAEGEREAPACRKPRLLQSKSGGTLVCFESQHRIYLSRLQNDSWTQPEELVTLAPDSDGVATVAHLDGQTCVLFEGADPTGHGRLCLATRAESSETAPSAKRTPVASASLAPGESQEWRRFVENARLFRKRPEDLVIFKRYLLRGLVLSERAARDWGGDGSALIPTAFEQGMYDWILLPKSVNAPSAVPWRTAERAMALSHQSEHHVLTGYFRPLAGQREPVFVVDNKQLNAPLPAFGRLQELKQAAGQTEVVGGSQVADEKMFSQFVNQSQGTAFLVTEDWQMLALLNKPAQASAFLDSNEKVLTPFWYPAAEPGRPSPLGVRVVAFATGKSYGDLVDALRERNFYIATDDIHLLARCDRRMPGEVFQTSFRPKINVVAQGTGKLARVEIWQDAKLVMSEEPPGAASVLEYENKDPDNAWHSYTVRVLQSDGAMAISQPFWIRYQP